MRACVLPPQKTRGEKDDVREGGGALLVRMEAPTFNSCALLNASFNGTHGIGENCSVDCDHVEVVPPDVQILSYVMYGIIFLVSLIGNGLVCYVVFSTPRMHTVTNYFIFNMAVGDILMTCLCVPFSFASALILQYWPFGWEMCGIVSFSQAVSVFVSAYTMVAISVDRYLAIIYPLKPRMTRLQAMVIVGGVWFVAVATAMPIAIVSKLVKPDDLWYQVCDRYVCMEDWGDQLQSFYYTLALMILQYVIPLLTLLVTYTRIAIVIWGETPYMEAELGRAQRMAKSKRKVYVNNSV
ncbi:unnamed protein product [Darwinula stevensoni]|uniref:G-protein coupled receptors family 1 profile domain-containing protein n=1 Tax=Darwinula stevensoni TaxID=69355 RepID=A0A7R9FPN5_9CRUS|nr:unnamed protein product [Darwinula stevensoni]CAG0897849.1 unnamed protein product [Darwinula stevensoni]